MPDSDTLRPLWFPIGGYCRFLLLLNVGHRGAAGRACCATKTDGIGRGCSVLSIAEVITGTPCLLRLMLGFILRPQQQGMSVWEDR